ncbi:MAG: CZB domain-containing protein, partial [Desulfobacula sp.]|nr:CZB domain-containing protein [Desulfobacula sp.]
GLDGELAQKEVDHLNWIVAVNKLISDDSVHELHVQTDHTKCGFGKWLFGEGRKEAEALVPTLAPLFKKIEEPHRLLHESAISMAKVYKEADSGLPGFLATIEVAHLQWAAAIRDAILNNAQKVTGQTDHTLCRFGKWLYSEDAEKIIQSDAVLARLFQEIKEPHKKLHESAKGIISEYRQVHPGLLDTLRLRLDDHRKWAAEVARSLIDGSQINVQTDPAKCEFGKWVESEEMTKLLDSDPMLNKIFTAIKEPHDDLHTSAILINDAVRIGDQAQAKSIFKNKTEKYLEEVDKLVNQAIKYEKSLVEGRNKAISILENETGPAMDKTQELLVKLTARSFELLQGQKKASEIFAHQTTPNLEKTQKFLSELRKEAAKNILTDEAMLAAARGTKRNVAIVSVIAILAGIFLAFIIARGIVTVLKRITAGMGEGANQVASASSQVSSSSQSMAEGASEQAASIEETSSSMEEMSSMTKKNAENAGHADGLMQEANKVVATANNSMDQLTQSMEDISKASEETSKIIKTID